MPAPSYKTCHRYNLPSHARYLTFSCYRRQPFLLKDRPRQWHRPRREASCNSVRRGLVKRPEELVLVECSGLPDVA